MKKIFLLTLLVTVFALSGAASAVELCYDGYCDGLSFTYSAGTGLVTTGNQTGCTSGPITGTVGNIFSQGNGATIGYDETATYGVYGLVTVIRPNRTWTHYANDGAGTSIVNQGTWTPGPCAVGNAAARSSIE